MKFIFQCQDIIIVFKKIDITYGHNLSFSEDGGHLPSW